MTTADLKEEIKKALDDAPESVLNDILDYLKQIKVTQIKNNASLPAYPWQSGIVLILNEIKFNKQLSDLMLKSF